MKDFEYRGWKIRKDGPEPCIRAEKPNCGLSADTVDDAIRLIDEAEEAPRVAGRTPETAMEVRRKAAFDAGCFLVSEDGWGMGRTYDHQYTVWRLAEESKVFSTVQSAWEYIRAQK